MICGRCIITRSPSLASWHARRRRSSRWSRHRNPRTAAARLYRGGRDGGSGVTCIIRKCLWNNFEAMGSSQSSASWTYHGIQAWSLHTRMVFSFVWNYAITITSGLSRLRPTDQHPRPEFGAFSLRRCARPAHRSGPAHSTRDNTAGSHCTRDPDLFCSRPRCWRPVFRSETARPPLFFRHLERAGLILPENGSLQLSMRPPIWVSWTSAATTTHSRTSRPPGATHVPVLSGELPTRSVLRRSSTSTTSFATPTPASPIGHQQRFSAGFEIMLHTVRRDQTLFR
jgi:hypothetical protein